MGTNGRPRVVLGALALALLVPTAALGAGFDDPTSSDTSQQYTPPAPGPPTNPQREDTPDDPNYDQSEPDAGGPANLFGERFDLFGFPSALTATTATYADTGDALHTRPIGTPMVSGFNAAGGWKGTRGRPDVAVAILDTGIKWDSCGLRDKLRLNAGELAGGNRPQKADGSHDNGAGIGGRDLNGNGAFDVDDYKDDARVGREFPGTCGGGVTGKDLINEFSDDTDADGNGYVDDIAGWNFFDDNNDPTDRSSYFAAENHGGGRAREAVEKGNDAAGSLGVCPKCQFVPIRIWDTFVSDANNFALATMYAADNGIDVVEGANGSLYHSTFSEAASQHAYEQGAAQVFSGDDLNTGNHNYPANYDHTMLIQGTVADVQGLGQDPGDAGQIFAGLCNPPVTPCLGANAPVETYFRGANLTQFGGHSSISMHGPTGSTNTGKAAGAAALVISAAKDVGIDPRPDETRAILEQTAEDVTAPNTAGAGNPDPAQPGWDEHFGWGRADVGLAVAVAKSGQLPPEVSIESPDWYAPLTGASVALTGRIRSRFATGGAFHYKVEWGVGLAPTTWNTVTEGDATGTVTNLGTLDLNAVRAALATHVVVQDTGGPVFSPASRNPFQDQFAVRVTVTGDGIPTPGVDRKVLTALPDGQALRAGFPKRLGTGGESPLRYADLNGDNVQELLVPTMDGLIHAYRPDGSELPGWPVETMEHYSATAHDEAPGFDDIHVPREPPRAPTIADLDGDGLPEIVTAAGLRIYVFQADGSMRPGFPVRNDPDFCKVEDQRQENAQHGAWHRKCGFLATPAVGRVEGPDKPPNIVAPSLDGHLYVLRPNGTSAPGFPVDLVDPAKSATEKRFAESINEPALADLNGDGKDDIVVPTNEAYGGGGSSGDLSLVGILGGASGQSARVYAVSGADGSLLPGWPVQIAGLIQDQLPMIGPGHSPAVAEIGGEPTVIASATSGSLGLYAPNGALIRTMQQGSSLNLFESASVGDVRGDGTLSLVKYEVGIEQAANLLLVGQNVPYSHYIGSWNADSGAPNPGYPTITDDYQFLSSSTLAKVNPLGPTNQILAGTGLGLLHAYDGVSGIDAPGFPKVTGGWMFAPAELSDDGRMAGITREGFLFEWETQAPACQSQWPTFRHDPMGSGNYDRDGTAPGAPSQLKLEALGGDRYRVRFISPGDDRMCGTPAGYVARIDGQPVTLEFGELAAGGQQLTEEFTLPAGTADSAIFSIQARDDADLAGDADNLGFPASARIREATPLEPAPPFGSGGGDAASCTDRLAPRSAFDRRGARVSSRRVKLFGSSKDRGCPPTGRAGEQPGAVTRVQVAVALRDHGRCRYLKRDRSFSGRRSCSRRLHFIEAKARYSPSAAATRFSFTLRDLDLPPGSYRVTVRGIDANGNVEGLRTRSRIAEVTVR